LEIYINKMARSIPQDWDFSPLYTHFTSMNMNCLETFHKNWV
jgi:hypothetical protein